MVWSSKNRDKRVRHSVVLCATLPVTLVGEVQIQRFRNTRCQSLTTWLFNQRNAR
ncbi:hypothetical protein D3C84_565480 [compost metagenome]